MQGPAGPLLFSFWAWVQEGQAEPFGFWEGWRASCKPGSGRGWGLGLDPDVDGGAGWTPCGNEQTLGSGVLMEAWLQSPLSL